MQFKGARQRLDTLYEFGLFMAWHIAAWTRSQDAEHKLPKLDDVLARYRRKGKPQTPQEQLAAIHRISADLGVLLKRRPKKKT